MAAVVPIWVIRPGLATCVTVRIGRGLGLAAVGIRAMAIAPGILLDVSGSEA